MRFHVARCALVALPLLPTLLPAQWTQDAPATAPSARSGAAMDFVPQNGGVVLFGGSAPFVNGETWTFDGTTWTQLSPATSPNPRFGAELVYDVFRGVAVLYGGLASNISIPPPTSETWEWDGFNWTQVTPVTNPGARYLYGACFDLQRGKTLLYGGSSSQLPGIPNSQLWEFDGTTWSVVTTTGNPGPRERPAMCFDWANSRTVMFGGGNGGGVTDETWLFDGGTATWTQVATSGPRPSARNAAKMTWDSVHGVCVLVGGQDQNGILSDTWTWDGASWSQVAGTPQTTRDHALAFLPITGSAVRFGGFVAAPNTRSDETWGLASGSFGAGCTGSNGAPTLASVNAPVALQSWTLEVGNLEPTFNLAFLVFGLTRVPGVDLGVLGMPGCRAYTTPDVLVSVAGAAGSATWTWPAVVDAVGASLYCEALCFDPTATAFGFTTSNGVYATIGG